MDISKLKRDANAVRATLTALPDNTTTTTTGCKIYVPVDYSSKGMAFIDEQIYVIGIYAIVNPDNTYAISKAISMVMLEPFNTNTTTIQGQEYYEFEFLPNDTVFVKNDVVMKDTLLFNVYDYFIDFGKVPWFLDYSDYITLFEHAKYYTGVSLGDNRAVMEMMAAIAARDAKDRTVFFRQTISSFKELEGKAPTYVPFRSVLWGPQTTTAKLMGAYFDTGAISALVNPNEKPEGIEELLRL